MGTIVPRERDVPTAYDGGVRSLLTLLRTESKVIPMKLADRLKRYIPTIVAIVALLVTWELWVDLGHVNRHSFSAPSEIAASWVDVWPKMWAATTVTIQEALAGFALALLFGILLGVLFYCSPLLNAAFFPLLTAAQTMPLITIAPLFIIWFGFEISGKIALIAVFSLFPIAVQTIRGLMAVPRYYEDVALTCGATRAWTLWHVKLRVASRQIFGGIRISASYLFATATTAEYMGARKGLGIWLQMAYNSFRTPLIFCATFMIVFLTGLVLLAVGIAERVLLGDDDTLAFEEDG